MLRQLIPDKRLGCPKKQSPEGSPRHQKNEAGSLHRREREQRSKDSCQEKNGALASKSHKSLDADAPRAHFQRVADAVARAADDAAAHACGQTQPLRVTGA